MIDLKKHLAGSGMVLLILLMAACHVFDRTHKNAARAFNLVMEQLTPVEYQPHSWRLTAPDQSAIFSFDNMSVAVAVDAAPFTAAGADISKLENITENALFPAKESLYFSSYGFDMLNRHIKETPQEQFVFALGCLREFLWEDTVKLRYHLNVWDGNYLIWTKDLRNSTEDILFVLDPEPFLAAGIDPVKMEGWTYSLIETEEGEIYKFIKAFDLK